MIYAINALALGWVCSIWSKSGVPNILVAFSFLVLAIANAAMAAPFIYRIIGVQ